MSCQFMRSHAAARLSMVAVPWEAVGTKYETG